MGRLEHSERIKGAGIPGPPEDEILQACPLLAGRGQGAQNAGCSRQRHRLLGFVARELQAPVVSGAGYYLGEQTALTAAWIPLDEGCRNGRFADPVCERKQRVELFLPADEDSRHRSTVLPPGSEPKSAPVGDSREPGGANRGSSPMIGPDRRPSVLHTTRKECAGEDFREGGLGRARRRRLPRGDR